eukprot:g39188.t1
MQAQSERLALSTEFVEAGEAHQQKPGWTWHRLVMAGGLVMAGITTAVVASGSVAHLSSNQSIIGTSLSKQSSDFAAVDGKSKGARSECTISYDAALGIENFIGGSVDVPGGYLSTAQVQFAEAGDGNVPVNSFGAYQEAGFRGYCSPPEQACPAPVTWQEKTTYHFQDVGSITFDSPFTSSGATIYYPPNAEFEWYAIPYSNTGYWKGKEVTINLQTGPAKTRTITISPCPF